MGNGQAERRRGGHLRAVPTSAREIELSLQGRDPAQNLDAEAAVLGALLLAPEAVTRVMDILRAEHFFSSANGKIYSAIISLAEAGQAIDLVTVAGVLRDAGTIGQIGGPSYLAELAFNTPAVLHVEDHAAIVLEHAQQRAYTEELWKQLAEAYPPLPLPGVVWRDQGAQRLNELASQGQRSKAGSVGESAKRLLEKYAALERQAPGTITGLPTGIIQVDQATGGLHARELTMLCAVEGKGKSSLAHSISVNVASNPLIDVAETIYGPTPENPEGWVDRRETRVERGVVIFSVDSMTKDEITERMACARQRIDSVKLKNGTATPEDWRRLTNGLDEIARLPILIHDETTLTPLVLRAKLRAAVVELWRCWRAKLALVVIDYVQLLGCDDVHPGMTEEQKLNRVGKSLLRTAETFDVPMLVLSQLNANGDTRDAKALQQHAQNKWVVTWKKAQKRTEIPGIKTGVEPHYATINIEKCRNGRTGPCTTFFHQTYTLYSDESQ